MRHALFVCGLAAASAASAALAAPGIDGGSASVTPQAIAQPMQAATQPATRGLGDGWGKDTSANAPDSQIAEQSRKSAELWQRLITLLAPSASPRDQALRATLMGFHVVPPAQAGPPESSGAILRRAAQAGASDGVVQWLWATASDADAGCTMASPCPGREGALARIDPENAAAWLPIFDRAWADDDSAGADAALARMADARRFDVFFIEESVAWTELLGRFPEIQARLVELFSTTSSVADPEVAAIISGIAFSAAKAIPGLLSLSHACDRGKEPQAEPIRFERCASIGRTMAQRGTSLSAQMIGLAVIRRTGQWSAQDSAMERELRWRQQQGLAAIPSQTDSAGFKQYFSDLQSTGNESQAFNRAMARKGIAATPPGGWDPSAESTTPAQH